MATWGVNTAQLYDPSARGAIQSVNFQISFKHFTCCAADWFLVLEQDGVTYFTQDLFLTPDNRFTWQTYELLGASESDYGTQLNFNLPPGSRPDFSDTGTPIAFGFGFGESSLPGSPDPGNIVEGADNWAVLVTIVPEPQAALLLLIAAGAVLRRKH